MCSEQGGTVLCALFGPQSSATYDLDYLLQRWLEPPVVTTIGVMILAFVGSIPVDRWLSDDSGQSKRAARWRFMRAGIWAYRGGSVGGVANIMFKGTGELLQVPRNPPDCFFSSSPILCANKLCRVLGPCFPSCRGGSDAPTAGDQPAGRPSVTRL